MTATSETPTSVNGTAPAADADETIPASERVMGAVGLAFAIGIALVALDLLTGGWLSALVAGGGDDG